MGSARRQALDCVDPDDLSSGRISPTLRTVSQPLPIVQVCVAERVPLAHIASSCAFGVAIAVVSRVTSFGLDIEAAITRSATNGRGTLRSVVGEPEMPDPIDAFIRSWTKTEAPGLNFVTSPTNLWVYGDRPRLDAFTAALARIRRRARFVRSQDLARSLDENEPRPLSRYPKEDARRRRSSLLCLDLRLEDPVGRAAFEIDTLVNFRYQTGRTTVVVSELKPSDAYDAWLPGIDEHVMPRLVGRILEAGDAVEVAEDGVFAAEFVFGRRAASDYRIRILQKRVGRVAVDRR